MSFGFGFALTAIAKAVGFSPKSLFANNEPGVWYDPSDLTTLFTDSAGTTPVTGVEQPVGLMLDKSKGLVLGSELVTNGDFSNGTTGWATGSGASSISIASGRLQISGSTLGFRASSAITTIVGRWYKATINTSDAGTRFLVSNNADGSAQYFTATLASGNNTVYFSATATTTYICPAQSNSSTATFTVDNISVRELPGNHAYQSTSANRPTLSARYNLLTKTEQFDDAAWTKSGASVTKNTVVAPDGTTTADSVAAAGTYAYAAEVYQTITYGAGTYTVFCCVKAGTAGWTYLQLGGATANAVRKSFNASTGAAGATQIFGTGWAYVSHSVQDMGDGWFRFSLTGSCPAGANRCVIGTANADNGASISSGQFNYIWGADLRVANDGVGLPAYQRVNTSTDYDTTGFPPYLAFNGSSSAMATNTITPGTDKAQVFAGVRKLSDAADAVFAETNTSVIAGNGALNIRAPNGAGTATYAFNSKGTSLSTATTGTSFSSPISSVLSAISDIASDTAILRINGTQAASSTADQGTGNYLAYPLYIGARGGSSLWFTGRLYALLVRFGPTLTATQIANTENWVNGKTKAY